MQNIPNAPNTFKITQRYNVATTNMEYSRSEINGEKFSKHKNKSASYILYLFPVFDERRLVPDLVLVFVQPCFYLVA